MLAEVSSELNVKRFESVDTLSGLMTWTVVPNFRALGPRLGPRINEVKQALATADGSALRRQLDETGAIEVAGERLTSDEVEIRAARHEAFALAEDGGWAVALDLELTDELRQEGLAREVVRAVNDLRKNLGLDLSDRVRLDLAGDPAVIAAVEANRAWVGGEVLAVDLDLGTGGEHRVMIDGHAVQVSLEKIPTS